MNKNRATLIALLILGVILIVGFQSVRIRIKENKNPDTQKKEQILTLKKEVDQSLPYTTISYEYPISGRGAELVKEREKAIVAQWKKENDLSQLSPEELANIGMGQEDGRTYELSIRYSTSENSKLLTHELQVYSFTGGAHGLTTVETISLDSKNTVISIQEIFTNKTDAPKLLKEKLRQKLYAEFSEKLYEDPKMVEDGLSGEAFDAIVMRATKSGLEFIFGQYQVGPYVSGIIEVELTTAELAGIVKPELLP